MYTESLREMLKMAYEDERYDRAYIDETVALCDAFYAEQNEKSKIMFGYPTNIEPLSPLTAYFFFRDVQAPLANNCGDNYERGNYRMDSKEIEKKIVSLFAEKFGAGEDFWGYITSGGSESNFCGIDNSFLKYPNGILYYSQAAHYSVAKQAAHYRAQVIPTLATAEDKIDGAVLCETVQANYEKSGAPANMVLTFGTTRYGERDDIEGIVAYMENHGIPFYLHVDAALFGGIPNNQEDAPLITDMKGQKIDSTCVSFHKYLGFPEVKSLFLAQKKPEGRYIPYIGHTDTTTAGSRAIPPFALYNHVRERLTLQAKDAYKKNITYFEALLNEKGIAFYRAEQSNIFVVDDPGENIDKQFQLACFQNRNGQAKAHVIIFPYHTKASMQALAEALQAAF